MTLNFYDLPWQLSEKQCPCDIHFNEYVNDRNIRNKSIFHFGTGAHHVVGLNNSTLDVPNSILGVTASKSEYQAYMDLVTSNTQLACTYKVIFADIYSFVPNVLPTFDFVTLFHIGEFWIGSGQGMHGEAAIDTPLSTQQLFDLFVSKLNPGGRVVLYQNSAGWDRIAPIVAAAMIRGGVQMVEEFKTLRFYERPAKRRGRFAFLRRGRQY